MNRVACAIRYGQIIDGRLWPNEAKWCVKVHVPDVISEHMINSLTGRPCVSIYCNRDISENLKRVFDEVVIAGLEHELKTFDGCYEIRDVRQRPGYTSAHSYALAVDFNAAENKLGHEPKMNRALVRVFELNGFTWGGNFKRVDGMHFQHGPLLF
jgi:hypothetical protein